MEKEDLAIFAGNLRALRERQMLSRRTLSDLCGMSKNAISRLERCERVPNLVELMIIADFFAVGLDALCREKNF